MCVVHVGYQISLHNEVLCCTHHMLAQNVKADESTRDKAAPILRKVVCTGTEESFEICDSKTLGLLNTSLLNCTSHK